MWLLEGAFCLATAGEARAVPLRITVQKLEGYRIAC